jgi:hypothetical protein
LLLVAASNQRSTLLRLTISMAVLTVIIGVAESLVGAIMIATGGSLVFAGLSFED